MPTTDRHPLADGRNPALATFASVIVAAGLAGLAILPGPASTGMSTGDGGRTVLMLILAAAAGVVGFVAFGYRKDLATARARLARLDCSLASVRQDAEAATAAATSSATVLSWLGGGPPRLLGAGLDARLGVPAEVNSLLDTGSWLESGPASQLRAALERLLGDGKSFDLTAATLTGTTVAITGFVHGPYAILRIADPTPKQLLLRETEERTRRIAKDAQLTRALFEALPVPVWFRGSDGRIDWVNSAYVRAVDGFSREDVRTRQVELLESRQRASVAASIAASRIHRERVHVFVGGERRSYDLVAVPLDGASAVLANDAAALETAQVELNRQVAAYDRTLDRVATAVANFGPDQRLVYSNEAYRQLWKLDPDWLKGRPKDGEILDRLREQRQLPEEADYRKWKSGLLSSYSATDSREAWWHLPNGRSLHLTIEQRPDGGVSYLYDDVTEKLSLERKYNVALRVQRGTLDTLREGVAVFATDGRLTLANASFARLWKLSPNDLAREPHIDEVVRRCSVLYDDMATWANVTRAVTTLGGQRQRLQGIMERPDQSAIAYAGLPLPDGNMLLTFVDVTDTARAERMLRERNEALVQADKLKSQFISLVSYELRSPLQNIIGFSEFLESPIVGPLNAKQREYLQDINGSSRTLLAIINDILDLTTIDAGALELKLGPVNVESVVQQAAAVAEERMQRDGIALKTLIRPADLVFTADEHRVRQILYNLISNAIGFSKPGGTVTIEAQRDARGIAISVRDEGAGIPLEEQGRVFDRFVSRSGGSRHRGAGLGLPIVKHLVELHGGTVSLVSEPGKGTRVTARFPADMTASSQDRSAA